MIKRVLYSLIIFASLCSCVSNDDIVIKNVNKVKIGSSSFKNIVVYIDLDVENNAPLKAKLREAEVVIYNGNNQLAAISLMEEVTIPKGLNENVVLPMRIEINGGLLTMALMKIEPENLTVDIYAKFTAPLYRKRIRMKNISLSELSENSDAEKLIETIEKLF